MTSPSDLIAALRPVVEAMEALGVPYLIGGSVAGSTHGMPRTTVDVDLVADLPPTQVLGLADGLKERYYYDTDTIREAVRRRTSFNLIHLETMLKIDVFVLSEGAFDRAAFARRRNEHLAADAGRPYALCSPEDIILQKLRWFRQGGETSERQWLDVLGVLRVQEGRLDQAYLNRWAAEIGVADLLARARAEV